MGVKNILEFVKIEHTLFSLPFVFIGAWIAGEPTAVQLAWILVAAVSLTIVVSLIDEATD